MATDTRMDSGTAREQIEKAIGAHGLWKMRLKSAIQQGKTDLDPAKVQMDNQCDFGKWLYGGIDPRLRSGHVQHYAEVKRLHAEFHARTAEIVRSIAQNRAGEADRLFTSGGQWAETSAALTKRMTEWLKAV